ncbi:MAG: segregation and condensation protein A [Butyricicoccaceae bacterium]
MTAIEFHLDAFDGPLDLLLHLIHKNKINIYDIPIAEILDQYTAILNSAASEDLEVAGDFIAMAAQLLYIKSRMLLPKPEEEAEEDPRAQLVEQLLEYQRIRTTQEYFRARGNAGRDIFVKPPEVLEKPKKKQFEAILSPELLQRAARRMTERIGRAMPPPASAFSGIVGRETVPVSVKLTEILQKFRRSVSLTFSGLFRGARSRSELVATFLAVLELSKTRRIRIEGEGSEMSIRLGTPEETEGDKQ